MHELKSRADLQYLVDEGIEESLTLEYKASAALSRDSTPVLELCKDVSAMANSAGGQIIYGIEEDKKTHRPLRVDEGVANPKITREWIEQILTSNVQPRMDCVRIARIDLENGRLAYVLTIDQSHTAHQAKDRKYYKRFELQAEPMYDYEIRNVMRRATTPDLHIELAFATGGIIRFEANTEISRPIILVATLVNRSDQPAYHAFMRIAIETDLHLLAAPDFKAMGQLGLDNTQYLLGKRIASPPDSPVFRELEPDMGFQYPIEFQVHSSILESHQVFEITTSVQAPGVRLTEYWGVRIRRGALELIPPGHP